MTGVTVLQTVDGGIDTGQNTTNRTTTPTSNIASTSSVLLAHFSTFENNPDNIAISDSAGNTWIAIGTVYDNNSRGAGAYYCRANAGSVGTKPVVTFSKGGVVCGLGCSIMEVVPDGTTVLDVVPVPVTGVSSGPAQAALGATSYTNDLLVAVLGIEQAAYVTCTPLAGYANVVSDTNTALGLQHIVQTRATTTSGSYTPGWTLSAASHWNIVAYALRGTTSAPTITGVSSATPNYLSSLTVTGVNFGATAGSVAVGGVTQTATPWADGSITIPSLSRGSNAYGLAESVVVTTSSSVASNTFAGITGVQPQTGWSFVNIGTPNTTAANRLTSTGGGDLASGDQVAWGGVVGTGSVTVNTDGTFVADAGVTGFSYEVWNTGNGWGSSAAETIGSGGGGGSSSGVIVISW